MRAIRWWLDELESAWADTRAALRLAPAGADGISIEAGADAFVFWRGAGVARRLMGRVPRPAGDPRAIDRALVAALAASRGPAVVELASTDTLTRRLRLPAASRAELARMLRYELAKHLPFPVEDACWYFRPFAAPRAAGLVEIDVTVAPLALARAARDELAALGIVADAIVASDLPAEARAGLSLLPPARAMSRAGGAARNTALVMALLAGFASLASPLLADRARLARLTDEIAALEPAARQALAAREASLRETERSEALARLRAASPRAMEVLAFLSDSIADGSWIVALSLAGSEIVLDGRSPSAAALAASLERTGRFERVSFRAPIARDPVSGLERFQISAVLSAGAR